jgi:hypothetical protein
MLLRLYLFFWKLVSEKLLFKFFCVYLSLEKLVNRKHFSIKKNLTWFSGKCFPFILNGKHFLEVMKNLEMSYYLLIISNLILKLLIAIYIIFWIFTFQFHPLKFNFYINFGPYFSNCYLLFSYHFLIEIFYLSNLIWSLFFWLLFILFEIIYEMLIIIILISSSFNIFIF